MNELPRRVWLEIDLKTLTANLQKIAATVAPASIMAVLKANAYGLGVEPIARALARGGAESFGVAEPHEALQLLPLNLPVQILSSILPDEIDPMVEMGVHLPVTDLTTAQLISQAAQHHQTTATVHFKIDTGMGRLGILTQEAIETITRSCALPNINCQGIFTHFPNAFDSGSNTTRQQIDEFRDLTNSLAQHGIKFDKCHIANSDGINNFPETCRPPFNVVRTGINLHGSFDSAGKRRLAVNPILTLKSRLTAIRTLPAGTGIGYGHTYRLHRSTRVGTVSAGYADGLPLALSNRGYLLVNNTPCPVIGRISMDYTTVSLESVPNAQVGDEVICLGGSGDHALRVEDWAALKGTHPYEIICSFGNRVKRCYL